MLKSLKKAMNEEKEFFSIPRKVQDIIPVKRIYSDGIFLIGNSRYSKSFSFEDINYQTSAGEDRERMFLGYQELLNSLDSSAATKITVNNRRVNRSMLREETYIRLKGDSLDVFRKEFNRMIEEKITSSLMTRQERYITVSVNKTSYEDARDYFMNAELILKGHFKRLGSALKPMDLNSRLSVIFDFFRKGEEDLFSFNIKDWVKLGHDFRDYITPDSFQLKSDYFMIGERHARVLFLKDYASFIKDSFIADMCQGGSDMMLSIDVIPVPAHEAIREIENRLMSVETNIANWQRKQNQNSNYQASIPYEMNLQRQETREYLDDLMNRNQKMMLSVITVVVTADTKKQLDRDTEKLMTAAKQNLCQMSILRFQQLDGLNTVLPYGNRKINAFRTLTSESLAVFMPFRVQEINDIKGIYYGLNSLSGNMITVDRDLLLNGNSFILGVSGSGKSFQAKNEITSLMLKKDCDIIILDPEREYAPLVKALGGEVIEISAKSSTHINPMDINRYYSDLNPVTEKSQFLQSLCEQVISGHSFEKGQPSIIDRCTENVYRKFTNVIPTLKDFTDELLSQPEKEAKSLALELELFTRGSLDTFSKHTNVNTDNRLICYDILDLGEQLRAIGMLVILDSILNRITENRIRKRKTYIFIDEIYLLFMHRYSSQFLFKLWKRVRKYGAFCTGITQNVEDLLQSHTARTMLSNSEFIIMLNQASTDLIELSRLLSINETEQSFIKNVSHGTGLIRVGKNMVPFINRFPRDTELYRLMTTKPDEY